MNPLISVIIPVYNAGESFHACIKSLLNQTFKRLELIFVLDCPTDGSDKVIEKYAVDYPQIVIVKNDVNRNIGISRNIGLSRATGEYVAFCDHDDIVEPFMYEEMYRMAQEKGADIVLGVPEYCYNNSVQNKIFYYPSCDDIRCTLLQYLIGQDRHDNKIWKFYFSHGVIWDNIYRRDIIVRNNIKFVDNNKCTFEDNLFLIDYLAHANSSVVYNKKCYNHIINGYNTSSKSDYTRYPLILEYVNQLNLILKRNHLEESMSIRFANTVVMYVTGAFVCEIKKHCFRPWKIITSYQIMKNNLFVKEAFRNSTIRPFSNNILKDVMLFSIHLIFKL